MKVILSNMPDDVSDVAEADAIHRIFLLGRCCRQHVDAKDGIRRSMVPTGMQKY